MAGGWAEWIPVNVLLSSAYYDSGAPLHAPVLPLQLPLNRLLPRHPFADPPKQVEALTRAPIVEELAARQQAPALAGGTRTAFPGPEAWW